MVKKFMSSSTSWIQCTRSTLGMLPPGISKVPWPSAWPLKVPVRTTVFPWKVKVAFCGVAQVVPMVQGKGR